VLERLAILVAMAGPVDLVLLRGLLADLPLREGALLGAKVLERQGARGLLALEGGRVWATLPEGVEAGARLRLRVVEASGERVHLKVVEAPAEQASPAAAYAFALPGGVAARVEVQEREAASGRCAENPARTVLLRVDTPSLGRLDLRVSASAVNVQAAAGEPVARAREEADGLRAALQAALGRAVPVTVQPVGFDARA
jgi:hypothetical protein